MHLDFTETSKKTNILLIKLTLNLHYKIVIPLTCRLTEVNEACTAITAQRFGVVN